MRSSRDESDASSVTRRQFLALVSGAALVVAIPAGVVGTEASDASPWSPNDWLTIDEQGRVSLWLHKAEMGQGARTALPMIVAEELGVDWRTIALRDPQPSDVYDMSTGGSGTVSDSWEGHRAAAASARHRLIAAAAAAWSVEAMDCDTRDGAVVHSSSGRSASFGSLVARARELPAPANVALRERSAYRLLGTRIADPATPDIVAGTQRFGIDVRLPGMLYASIERPPSPISKPLRVDEAAARKMRGFVRSVATDAGVAAIARDTWSAQRARTALKIDWSKTTRSTFDDTESAKRLATALDRGGKTARANGDVRGVLASAAKPFVREYGWCWQAHAALEPLNCIAHVTREGCDIWAGTQNANRAQKSVAKRLGIDPARVRIHAQRLGGGFGRRLGDDYIVEAAALASALDAPVQVLWTREDEFQFDFYNPAQRHRISAVLGDDGAPTAWRHVVADHHLAMFGPYDPAYDPAADGDPWGAFDTPYEFPHFEATLSLIESPVRTGAWRAVSYPGAVLARECMLDEIAVAANIDPVELRLRLIPSPGNVTRGSSIRPNGDRLRRVVIAAADRAGWKRPLSRARGDVRVGRGFACNAYHGGTMVAQVAEVEVARDGTIRVQRIVSAVECGLAVNLAGVEKQFEGGVAWALSALLGPGIHFDAGRATARSFTDYRVLTIADMPRVETHVLEATWRPFGIGEPPVPAVAPAVLNAIYDATKVRLRSLPLDRETLRQV